MSYEFDGIVIPCNDTFYCPRTGVCYFTNKQPELSKIGQCGCSLEFGELGPECNQKSLFTYYRAVAMGFAIIFSFLSLLFVVYEMIQLYKKRMGFSLTMKETTLFFCVAFYSFIFIRCSLAKCEYFMARGSYCIKKIC